MAARPAPFHFIAQIKVDHVPAANAQALLADFKNFAGGDVARNDVAIFGIFFFEKIVSLGLGDIVGPARVARLARHPDAAPFATGRFGNQSALVFAGDGRRMNLDHLRVAISCPGLIAARDGAAGADDGHGAFAEDQSIAAGGHDDRIGAKRANLHRAHVLGDDSNARAIFKDRPEKFPELVLIDAIFAFPAAGLLIEGIEQLLAGGGAGKKRALVERPAEQSQIAFAFGRAVEGDAHAVEQVDDLGCPSGHFEHRRLVGEKIAAQHGFIEMFPFAVALLSGDIVAGVDAALAQTLWLRLTGTMENRSTATPSSASLMVQASPANPPPTTITRFWDGRAIVTTSIFRAFLVYQLGISDDDPDASWLFR